MNQRVEIQRVEIQRVEKQVRRSNLEFALEMQARTKAFALRIIRLFQALPKTTEAGILGRQVLRSGTSFAANYRAACRAKSPPDFAAKMKTVVEEVDETVFWIDLLVDAGIISAASLKDLRCEGDELLHVFSASHATAKKKITGKL
ncbi:MAG: four helix bundle protein [Verrucomicrobiales bacterium]